MSGDEEAPVFVDHSYCLPLPSCQESVDEKMSELNKIDHDYASSPMSPSKVTSPPKKTPLKDQNHIVEQHLTKKDITERKQVTVFHLPFLKLDDFHSALFL